MIKYNVTLSNNTSLQVIANSMEDVLQAFKAEIVGIVRDDVEERTSEDVDRMEWIRLKDFDSYEFYFDNDLKTIVVACGPADTYTLTSFAYRLGYSKVQAIELIAVVKEILDTSSDNLVLKRCSEDFLNAKVKGSPLLDVCLLSLVKKVLKALK